MLTLSYTTGPIQNKSTGEVQQPAGKAHSVSPATSLEEGMAALLSEAPGKSPTNKSVAGVIAEMMGETKFCEVKDASSMHRLLHTHIKDANDPDWYT